MVTETRTDDLAVDLRHLATSLESLAIDERLDRGRPARQRDWVVRTISDYLIPRIEDPAAPLLVVVAGPTGAGKSTLLNSVAGGVHSVAGPLRPTTTSPVVLASRSRAHAFARIGGVECHVATGRAPILDELTLVDTPDIDSTSTEHRAIAETMIDNADVVVYVTSALRYADLVPWEVLRRAHSRGVPVIHVLNRLKSSASGAVADYRSRLRAEGLGPDVVAVHEHHMPRGAQSVPLAVIQELRNRLLEVVEARHAGSADVVQSVVATTIDQAEEVISAISDHATVASHAASRVADGLSIDLDRITSGLLTDSCGPLDLGPLAELAAKRLRTRGRVRRRLPSSATVTRARRLLDASLISAVDADIRRQAVVEALQPWRNRDRRPDFHATVVDAVAVWHQDLDEMPVVTGTIDPPLASLLLALWCVGGGDERIEAAMEVLTRSSELVELEAQARERLARHLIPVYTSVGFQVMARTSALIATDAEIYRVKASLSAVIARSSFAHA
ncbi:MAG: GTPase domain-containing protein [Acidimicrobiia bacterium]